MEIVKQFFSSADLTPHGFCLLWRPDLLMLHVLSDSVIGLSYYAIPFAIAYFLLSRRDVAFGWVFWMFAAFILACGTTHWLEVWTLWHPDYGVQGAVKLMTAVISAATALTLLNLVPRALALRTEFLQVSTALTSEVQQRREVADALQQSELRYRLLVESIADYAIFSLDLNGIIQDWNAGAERMKGYRAEEVIGRHFSMFYLPEERDRGEPVRALENATREGRHESEGLRLRRDGSQFWANFVIDPIRDRDGNVIGFVKITRNISRQREMEERLRQSQRMEAIGKLTGGVAHDFNNHLTIIYGSLERARKMVTDNPRLTKALDAAMNGAERAAALTGQLLAFSRRQPLASKPTDVGQLLTQTSGLLDRVLGERIVVEMIRGAEVWPAFCDRSQLESAVLNLAVNSRDAMLEGGKLTIAVANARLDAAYAAIHPGVAPGDYVMIAVTDTGFGMSRDVLDHAFEPFFTTKPESHGTGLGLSQVFGFVTQSRGYVWIESVVGQGTTVRLYLPRATHPIAPASAAPDGEPPRGAGETILVVEDDADVRAAVVAMVSDLGYAVIEADGPEPALRVLAERPVALVFSDVVMPGPITSRELAERARALQPGAKILFTSGYTQNRVDHDGRLDEGIELIVKPYRQDELARRLRSLLGAGQAPD